MGKLGFTSKTWSLRHQENPIWRTKLKDCFVLREEATYATQLDLDPRFIVRNNLSETLMDLFSG